ncbi:uncharacterized protein LOC131858500 [Cryptomeria japonica]|uniref:uncharacterized protein LOC131858500 n=1 Tax=Cryptomeria japonica TaxID=3369 RepID=UPI0027D9D269|nr:uncharacterized protein LOC131858500 [Cryptomeria japonica]
MDGKQIPLIGQVKDAQAVLAACPDKRILFQECEFGNYLILVPNKKELEEAVDEQGKLWQMEFDGSCANSGSGMGAVLFSPNGNVRNVYSVKNDRLKHYRNRVWDEIEPSVPDNVNHWQVFDTDAQIKDFLECTHSFVQSYFEGSEDSCKEFCPDLDSVVKSILTQQEVGLNKRATWVTKIQEYDLDIHPTKTIKGQGLCKLIAENRVEMDEGLPLTLFVGLQDTWFFEVAYYLTYGCCPGHLSTKEKRNLKLKAAKYVIWQDVLCKKGLYGTYLRCVDKPQQRKLLEVYHDEACGGHFSSLVTAFKILRNCFDWPGMFRDVYNYVKECEKYQLFFGKPHLVALPLRLVVVDEPFKQWGIDFIGPIIPHSSADHMYILKATDYFTKWVEVVPTKKANSEVVCNGLAESSNKNLVSIMKKLVDDNARNWHKKVYEALWVDIITPKRAIGMEPYELVYGIGAKVSLPLELAVTRLQTVIEDSFFQNALEKRVMHLIKLEEEREMLVDRITKHQNRVKKIFDMRARPRGFLRGDEQFYFTVADDVSYPRSPDREPFEPSSNSSVMFNMYDKVQKANDS